MQVLIQLSEIVKAHLRLGKSLLLTKVQHTCLLTNGLAGFTQISPDSVAHSFIRNMTQTLFDLFDASRQGVITTDVQQYRILTRKPAYRTRNVHIRQNVLTSVSLQVDQAAFMAGPCVQHHAQSSQKQIIHFRVICAVCLLQQPFSLFFRKLDDHCIRVSQGKGLSLRLILRQTYLSSPSGCVPLLPVGVFTVHGCAIRIGGKFL
ncbi:hypothetical protein D3C74_236980 [compost metagenome]